MSPAITSPLHSPTTAQSIAAPNHPPKRLKLAMALPNRRSQIPPVIASIANDVSQTSTLALQHAPPTPHLPPSAERSQSHSTPAPSRQAELGHHQAHQSPTWIDQPAPTPINLDENTDAIALRSAISILQLQRDQGIRDIRSLDRMKRLAKERPEDFLRELESGRLSKSASSPGIDLDFDDAENDDDDNATSRKHGSSEREAGFGQLPSAQNVVRAPPIEWAKYHVVGEPLDKLHEQQRQRPGAAQYDTNGNEIPGAMHAIAVPFDPFNDRLQNATPGGAQIRATQSGTE